MAASLTDLNEGGNAGNSDFTELTSNTIRNYGRKFWDNVFYGNVLTFILKKKSKVMKQGGHKVTAILEYDKNPTAKFFSGYEEFDLSQNEIATTAEDKWSQLGGVVRFSGYEQMVNRSKERLIPLVESRIKNLEKTLAELLERALLGPGPSETSGHANYQWMNGIGNIVGDTTSELHGITPNTTTRKWWTPQATTSATVGTFKHKELAGFMRRLSWGAQHTPDILISREKPYGYFSETLLDKQRFTDKTLWEAGFRNLLFDQIPWYWLDEELAETTDNFNHATTKKALWDENEVAVLNTDYLQFLMMEGSDSNKLSMERPPAQDAYYMGMTTMGQLMCTRRNTQGIFKLKTA